MSVLKDARELLSALRDYLQRIAGHTIDFDHVPGSGLPLHLQHAYVFWRTPLFGREVLFAVSRTPREQQTPNALAADLRHLEAWASNAHVALVLPWTQPHIRNQLTRTGVPFVVPDRQLFLPNLLVDLREHFPRQKPGEVTRLGWAAQVALLRHLLFGDIEGRPLQQVAMTLGYSKMTLSNVRDQLVGTRLCEEVRSGRSKPLQFLSSGKTLFDSALNWLRSPVKEDVAIRSEGTPNRTFVAGISALSARTLLGEDRIPTLAMLRADFHRGLTANQFHTCPFEDEASHMIQVWQYDPALLTTHSAVDPLSLCLTLWHDPDERVQLALQALLDGVTW